MSMHDLIKKINLIESKQEVKESWTDFEDAKKAHEKSGGTVTGRPDDYTVTLADGTRRRYITKDGKRKIEALPPVKARSDDDEEESKDKAKSKATTKSTNKKNIVPDSNVKRRGRPPGSKNKPKTISEMTDSEWQLVMNRISIMERELSEPEKKKKEEIAKSMKDSPEKVAGLKKRYGKRWKEVVYATATKKAKELKESQNVAEEQTEESALQAYLGKKKYGEEGMKALQQAGREGASKEKMAKIRAQHDKMDEQQGVAEADGSFSIVFYDAGDDVYKTIAKGQSYNSALKIIKNNSDQMYDEGDHLRKVAPNIYVHEPDYKNTGERASANNYKHMYHWIIKPEASGQDVAEAKADPTSTWVVYDGDKVKRFKTHEGAKEYAEQHGGKVASSAYYADKIQGKKDVAEGKGSKPDFLDVDEEGDRKESFKKAVKDKETIKEGGMAFQIGDHVYFGSKEGKIVRFEKDVAIIEKPNGELDAAYINELSSDKPSKFKKFGSYMIGDSQVNESIEQKLLKEYVDSLDSVFEDDQLLEVGALVARGAATGAGAGSKMKGTFWSGFRGGFLPQRYSDVAGRASRGPRAGEVVNRPHNLGAQAGEVANTAAKVGAGAAAMYGLSKIGGDDDTTSSRGSTDSASTDRPGITGSPTDPEAISGGSAIYPTLPDRTNRPSAATAPTAPTAPTSPSTYQVGRGDTLSQIAQRNNTSVRELIRLNPEISNPDVLRAGQKINIAGAPQSTYAGGVGTAADTQARIQAGKQTPPAQFTGPGANLSVYTPSPISDRAAERAGIGSTSATTPGTTSDVQRRSSPTVNAIQTGLAAAASDRFMDPFGGSASNTFDTSKIDTSVKPSAEAGKGLDSATDLPSSSTDANKEKIEYTESLGDIRKLAGLK